MFNALIRLSLRFRFFVLVTSLVLLVYGSYLSTTIPIDVFPDLDRPRVIILTECPGLSTNEVETLVTHPIETGLLGANGVEAVRSQSTAGLAVIYVEFGWETEIFRARQTVQERLSSVEDSLPIGIHPEMTPPSSIMGQIIIAGMYRQEGPNRGRLIPVSGTNWLAEISIDVDGNENVSVWHAIDRRDKQNWKSIDATNIEKLTNDDDDFNGRGESEFRFLVDGVSYRFSVPSLLKDELELGTLGDWVVRPSLLKVSGVAECFLQGSERKQYQILVDPEALNEYGLSLQEVERAVKESNINSSGGFAVRGESERPIRILGRIGPQSSKVIEDLNQVPVRVTDKRSILLEQVCQVTEGPRFKRGDGAINGRPGLVFTIVKQPHVDTRKLTQQIEDTLADIESSLPANILINSELFQLKNFIDRGLFNVGEALAIGAVLVIGVLFLFLLNFRVTFITLTAIPLSLVVTTLVFRIIGFLTDSPLTINVMTLGGIAVAMGELVDDAIVDVENIFRRLRENHEKEEPRSNLLVVYEASCEIRSAIVFGTIVVILVFLPLFAISGVAGRLFEPLGIAYIVSILSSLLVSLTVTPVLSYYLLSNAKTVRRNDDGWLLRTLKQLATPLIRMSMKLPGPLLLATWCCVFLAGLFLTNLGRSFLPDFDEGSVQVNVTLPPGSSLEASNNISSIIDTKFRSLQVTPDQPNALIRFLRSQNGAGGDG